MLQNASNILSNCAFSIFSVVADEGNQGNFRMYISSVCVRLSCVWWHACAWCYVAGFSFPTLSRAFFRGQQDSISWRNTGGSNSSPAVDKRLGRSTYTQERGTTQALALGRRLERARPSLEGRLGRVAVPAGRVGCRSSRWGIWTASGF